MAILSIDDYQKFIGETLPAEKIEQCEAAIDQAIKWAETEVGYPIVVYDAGESSTTIDTQIIDGHGHHDFLPRYYPVAAVGDIGSWDGEDFDTIDPIVYLPTVDTASNMIYFGSGDIWAKGRKNWQVEYYYGFTDAIPDDLKRGILHVVRMFMGVSTRDTSIQSQSDGEHSVSYFKAADPQLPQEAIKVIAKYKRYGAS